MTDQPVPDQSKAPTGASGGNVKDTGPAFGQRGLADALLDLGDITADQYTQVKLESVNTGKTEAQIVVEHNLVNEGELTRGKAKLYNIPFVNLSETSSSPVALSKIPESVARRYKIFPFALDKKAETLSVAMVDPLDLEVVKFLEQKSGCKIAPHFAPESVLMTEIAGCYAQSLSTQVTEALKESGVSETEKAVDLKQIGQVIREAPIAKIVATLLEFAIKSRASDTHIEPLEEKTRVRYRIDGILHEKLVLPKKVHEALVSRIKILCNMKIDEKRVPQDGRFNFQAAGEEVDLRVSSLPTAHGEKIVMRLLKKTGKVPTLPELGLRGTALKNLDEAILIPHGIILITGPTGSGKTTTLYSILSKINTPRVNIITLEDPVEYEIPGVNQVQTNPAAGLTFASGMRSFLRQDPNIIMVGEIRDTETTELAIQASLTGHLVFSTLHTNSAAGALPRLLDMGGEPFLLASSMTCVVGQRVVRRICNACKESYTPPPEVKADVREALGKLFGAWLAQRKLTEENLVLFRGRKCPQCNDTGYSGRIGIFEVFLVTEKIGRLILEHAPASAIEKQATEDGMILMKQDGYLKALEGITSLEEVLRVAQV